MVLIQRHNSGTEHVRVTLAMHSSMSDVADFAARFCINTNPDRAILILNNAHDALTRQFCNCVELAVFPTGQSDECTIPKEFRRASLTGT